MLESFSLFSGQSRLNDAANLDELLVRTSSIGLYEKPTRQALDDVLVGLFEVLNDFHDSFGKVYAVKRYPLE